MSDSRELAHRNEASAPVRQSDNLLAQVIAAAKDPTIDAEKMRTLAELVNGQQDREREIEFNQSKNAAIMEMPVITKDGRIVITKDGRSREQGRFAKWEDIDRVVRPILQRHNLALSFDMDERQGGGITVTPILSHTNGYTQRGGAFPVPAEDSGSKNKAQAMGSSASYGKRYAGCAMLNIVTEGVDDDGNLGRGTVVSLPYEREQTVLAEAVAAAEQGRYQEWYTTQSPKDRAWLVSSGKHAEFGGQPVIAAPKSVSQNQSDVRSDNNRPTEQPPAEEQPATTRRTPRQMVDDFKRVLESAGTSREVVDLQAVPKTAEWLSRLQDVHPDLWQEVSDHAARLYSTLVAQEREASRSGDKLV